MARAFNGTSDYASITGGSGFGTYVSQSTFTVSFWFMQTALYSSGRQILFGDWNSGGTGQSLIFQIGSTGSPTDGHLKFGLGSNGEVESGVIPTKDVWYHVACVWAPSGAGGDGYERGYVGGVQKFASNSPPSFGAGTTMALGRAGAYNGLYFGGRIAEFSIWTDALTAIEIAALAAGANPRLVHPQDQKLYVPLFGADSPEPSYTGTQGSITLTSGTAKANHPPVTLGLIRPRPYFPQAVTATAYTISLAGSTTPIGAPTARWFAEAPVAPGWSAAAAPGSRWEIGPVTV